MGKNRGVVNDRGVVNNTTAHAQKCDVRVTIILLYRQFQDHFRLYNIIPCILHTGNNDSEDPCYSTVYTGQPDVIKMKENDAYGKSLPGQREIIVEENTAYGVTTQKFQSRK